MSQITQSKIKIYEFPDDVGCSNSTSNGTSNPEDEKERRENRKLKERVPFAVVGSNTLIDSPDGGEKKIRGRRYPWGIVDVSTSHKLNVSYFLLCKNFKFIAREICNISLLEIIGGKYGALRFCTPSQYVNTNPSTRPQRSNK